MTECIEPELIKEGDLIAYVEGVADERVRDHVIRCTACADKVARLRQTSQALIGLMYRSSCPPPEVLGKYQLDLLSAGERLRIAAHVRSCSHCTRELDELAQEESEEAEDVALFDARINEPTVPFEDVVAERNRLKKVS